MLGEIASELIDDLLYALRTVPLEAASEVMDALLVGAGLRWFEWSAPMQSANPAALIGWLRTTPRLEWILLAHSDGYVRQAALERIEGPVPSALFVGALLYRLNDWVPQVRRAAKRAMARSFPETGSDLLAGAALFLIERGHHWQRWDQEEVEAVEDLLGRPEVVAHIATMIASRPSGGMARLLASASRWRELDPYLDRLAREAVQPAVRALASRILLQGRARWPAAWRKRWIDRSLGLSRVERSFREREVDVPIARETILASAASDRSGRVRRVAAQALIDSPSPPELQGRLLSLFLTDRDAAVRERAEFLRKRIEK